MHIRIASMITAELQPIFIFDGGMQLSDQPTLLWLSYQCVVVTLWLMDEGKRTVTSRCSHALSVASLHSWAVGCVIRRFHSVNGCVACTFLLKGQPEIQSLYFNIRTCKWEATIIEVDSGEFSFMQTWPVELWPSRSALWWTLVRLAMWHLGPVFEWHRSNMCSCSDKSWITPMYGGSLGLDAATAATLFPSEWNWSQEWPQCASVCFGVCVLIERKPLFREVHLKNNYKH